MKCVAFCAIGFEDVLEKLVVQEPNQANTYESISNGIQGMLGIHPLIKEDI